MSPFSCLLSINDASNIKLQLHCQADLVVSDQVVYLFVGESIISQVITS